MYDINTSSAPINISILFSKNYQRSLLQHTFINVWAFLY